MTNGKQYIQDRMMQSAARFWGLPETDTVASFDPIVALLMGACATELEKINGEIENSRTRVLERLVQLLSPEALTGVLPAHGIAHVMPTEEVIKTDAQDQLYASKRFAPLQDGANAVWKDIYFSPAGEFILHKVNIKYKAIGKKIVPLGTDNTTAQFITTKDQQALPLNKLWLGIEANSLNVDGLTFYFDVLQQSHKDLFFNQLPKANWYINGKKITHNPGYPTSKKSENYFDVDAVLNRDISVTEKWESHIHQFYTHHFITLSESANKKNKNSTLNKIPDELTAAFNQKDLEQMQANNLHWLCVEFPENISTSILEDVIVSTNCFPVVNRHLHEINYLVKDIINIIPLLSEDAFLDILSITNQHGNLLHVMSDNENDENDFSVLLRYAGVSRFDNREAAEMVDKLIHLLREESAAFSTLGTEFLQNEMITLQQTINKLTQQIVNKQLLKGNTPYLIINNKQSSSKQNLFIKFWSSNGIDANLIKAGTPLNMYSSSHFESGTAKLVTTTHGGRDKLNDSDKVLAYKSALLSKQKLVTNEDIIAFCKLRLAMNNASIKIQKGSTVLAGLQQGLVRTLDVEITLQTKQFNLLKEKGTIEFWQKDVETAIVQHSNFFIPLRVFIKLESIVSVG